MSRLICTWAVVMASAGLATAQDMPLSQILIEGEGWKPARDQVPLLEATNSVMTRKGFRFSLDGERRAIRAERPGQQTRELMVADLAPSAIALSPDDSTLIIGNAAGKYLWAFTINDNGSLGEGDRFYSVRVSAGQKVSGVTALTVDEVGRVYACTPLGVQVFDTMGRLSGVLGQPGPGKLTAIAFGGTERDVLYVKCGNTVHARKTKTKGVDSTAK